MARLRAQSPQKAKLKSSGYMGEPTGEEVLTENRRWYNVKDDARVYTDIPDPELKDVTFTENGTYNASEEGVYGYREVTVDVQPTLQQRTAYPSINNQTIIPEPGFDGLSRVNVRAAKLWALAVTPTKTRQIIYPPAGYYGFERINVDPTPLESITVPAKTTQETYTPQSPNIGFSSVTVEAIPELIKNYNVEAILNGTLTHFYTEATIVKPNFCSNLSYLVNADMPYTTRIEGNAFLRCSNLTNINCPNLEIIGDYAFQGSGVSWTRFPFKIITIGGSAFRQCSQLVNVVMPSGLQSIGELAFYQCTALQTFDLSECLQIPTLGANAFAYTTCTFLFRDQTQLDAYASATNWSTYADRFQIKGA